jgi:hypothetical protein
VAKVSALIIGSRQVDVNSRRMIWSPRRKERRIRSPLAASLALNHPAAFLDFHVTIPFGIRMGYNRGSTKPSARKEEENWRVRVDPA